MKVYTGRQSLANCCIVLCDGIRVSHKKGSVVYPAYLRYVVQGLSTFGRIAANPP